MNKIIVSIIVFVVFCISFTGGVQAQSQKILGVVTYVTHEDLLFIFQNTDRTLVYLDGESVEEPTFVGIFTSLQKDLIEKRNLKFKTIDENVNIAKYVMLYNPIPDQGSKLGSLGKSTQFTKKFTLLKLSEGKEFTHEGVGGEFFEVPFLEGITPPPNATPVEPLTVQDKPVEMKKVESSNIIIIVGIVLGLIAVVGFGLYLLYSKRKKGIQ
ncbi:MAG: hypothetical protein Q7T54_05590 [Candidatus Levybacteria bacterium]|nr:hypothetical protein [Candidatus Levybacteria bacterium]